MHRKYLSYIILFLSAISFSSSVFAEPVWIDVRSFVEHKIDNIEGDIRISHSSITNEISKTFPNKSTEIHLYCRSGGRAGQAQAALIKAGYTNVTNDGGIQDARKKRGLNK